MVFNIMPRWFKRTIAIAGLILALPGFFIGLGLLGLTLILIIDNDTGAIYAGLIGFTLLMLTVGTGGATFWHSIASLNGKVSKPLRLPSLWGLAGIFVLYFTIGVIIYQSDFVTALFLPPVLLVAAATPSLIAVLWFTDRQLDGLTWRRGIIAFAGAATLSLIIFIILQFVILVIVSMLNSNPSKAMVVILQVLFEGFSERNGISRMLDRRFAYFFVQLVIIIPVIAALAKPLVTLPLLGQLSRRETFLLGAMAGAGFAFVENMFFLDYELRVWRWILIVQALGGAIHPLGSGLVALGLWEVARGKPNAWSKWLAYIGIAVALHSLWGLGFLIIISKSFLWRETAIGVLILLLLVGLAIGTPWAGRSIGRQLSKALTTADGESVVNRPFILDRGIVVWALATLITILPIGIIGLRNLLR